MERFGKEKSINYSGYRDGQSPLLEIYPSKKEIYEDLKLLEGEYKNLRIYDCSLHAYRVLDVIVENEMDFKVMLGLSLFAEENHVNHPYFFVYGDSVLQENKKRNGKRVVEIVEMARKYRSIVNAVSIGNETRSEWSNNRVSVDRLIEVAKTIQLQIDQPVTFCEEYHKWIEELQELGDVLDFISIHTYPAWQGSKIETALDIAINNYNQVKKMYPNKVIAITETGWPTSSHGSKIKVEDATIRNQLIYNEQITNWGLKNGIPIYLFEAFDEKWKGEKNPDEPEKNWGIYYSSRKRKEK